MAKYTDKQKLEAVKAYRKGTGGLHAMAFQSSSSGSGTDSARRQHRSQRQSEPVAVDAGARNAAFEGHGLKRTEAVPRGDESAFGNVASTVLDHPDQREVDVQRQRNLAAHRCAAVTSRGDERVCSVPLGRSRAGRVRSESRGARPVLAVLRAEIPCVPLGSRNPPPAIEAWRRAEGPIVPRVVPTACTAMQTRPCGTQSGRRCRHLVRLERFPGVRGGACLVDSRYHGVLAVKVCATGYGCLRPSVV